MKIQSPQSFFLSSVVSPNSRWDSNWTSMASTKWSWEGVTFWYIWGCNPSLERQEILGCFWFSFSDKGSPGVLDGSVVAVPLRRGGSGEWHHLGQLLDFIWMMAMSVPNTNGKTEKCMWFFQWKAEWLSRQSLGNSYLVTVSEDLQHMYSWSVQGNRLSRPGG
jgi:hypothetical protein